MYPVQGDSEVARVLFTRMGETSPSGYALYYISLESYRQGESSAVENVRIGSVVAEKRAN